MNKHYQPEIFHGNHVRNDYFEGWYFKHVSEKGDYSISFIPGVSITENDTHAFIQILYLNNDKKMESHYLRFDYNDFSFTDKPFSVNIANSYFSLDRIHIDLNNEKLAVFGDIYYRNIIEIKKSLCSPNIMGYFSYIPNMECNHGVLSMSHHLEGELKLNDELLCFSRGKGYIEKDWGISFPADYLWLQSNHFKNPNTSFFCSIATIPFMGFKFRGLICNLIINGDEYRFATYNNSKIIKYNRDGKHVYIKLKNKKYYLEIMALVNGSENLIAPDKGKMNIIVKEGLMGEIKIILRDKCLNKIYEDKGINSGIEMK